MTNTKTSKFKTGSGCYVCRVCKKNTRETGEGESSVEMCAACYYEAGLENEHSDGHHDAEPHADCPDCKAVAGPAKVTKKDVEKIVVDFIHAKAARRVRGGNPQRGQFFSEDVAHVLMEAYEAVARSNKEIGLWRRRATTALRSIVQRGLLVEAEKGCFTPDKDYHDVLMEENKEEHEAARAKEKEKGLRHIIGMHVRRGEEAVKSFKEKTTTISQFVHRAEWIGDTLYRAVIGQWAERVLYMEEDGKGAVSLTQAIQQVTTRIAEGLMSDEWNSCSTSVHHNASNETTRRAATSWLRDFGGEIDLNEIRRSRSW